MRSPIDAAEILDRDFLGMRAKLLELAATRDRIDRADGSVTNDPRLQKILQAIEILASKGDGDGASRAEQVQRLFSNDYDAHWRSIYQLPQAR